MDSIDWLTRRASEATTEHNVVMDGVDNGGGGLPSLRPKPASTAAAPASIPPCVARKDDSFHLTQCSRLPLVPRARIPAAAGGSFGVLLAISREHDAPLLSQAERILLQLRAARRFGLAPVAYLGERVFMPIGCESPTPPGLSMW